MFTMRIPSATKWQSLTALLDKTKNEKRLSYLFENSFLVGGTALALQIKHRLSYDLDFMWTAGKRLPWRVLTQILEETLASKGITVKRLHNSSVDVDLLNAGLAPEEHYLLYQAETDGETVKIEVWVPDDRRLREIVLGKDAVRHGLIRLASPESIFALKALALPQRCTWRDLFDLYTLAEDSSFPSLSYERIVSLIKEHYSKATVDSVLSRLENLKIHHLGNQGFLFYDGTCPNWEELFGLFKKIFFFKIRNAWFETVVESEEENQIHESDYEPNI